MRKMQREWHGQGIIIMVTQRLILEAASFPQQHDAGLSCGLVRKTKKNQRGRPGTAQLSLMLQSWGLNRKPWNIKQRAFGITTMLCPQAPRSSFSRAHRSLIQAEKGAVCQRAQCRPGILTPERLSLNPAPPMPNWLNPRLESLAKHRHLFPLRDV